MSYRVFVRNWWRKAGPGDGSWPGGLVPNSGARGRTIRRGVKTEEEARAICAEWNRSHAPGRLSKKAEYREE